MHLEVLAINSINEFESALLAMTLSAMWKAGDCDAAASVGDINTRRIARGPDHGNSQSFDGMEIGFIFLIAVEGEKNVKTGLRIIALD